MLRRSLAVSRTVEQAIDLFFISVRRTVRQKSVDFFRSRRQADQVETEAAQERRAIGLEARAQVSFLEFSRMKASIGFVGQVVSLTLGTSGCFGGANAQCARSSAVIGFTLRSSPLASGANEKTSTKTVVVHLRDRLYNCMFITKRLSCQNRLDHRAARIGESRFAAFVEESQAGVIEPEKVKDRRVQVVNMNAIDLGAKADRVGRP